MVNGICQWLNQISPRTDEENEVIQYGLGLFLDNIGKILLIFAVGCVIGKFAETCSILLAFCILRSQAGGAHADSNLGCMAGMCVMWLIALIAGDCLYMNQWVVWLAYLVCLTVIIICAPNTKNINYYTNDDKRRKKIFAVAVLTVCIVAAIMVLKLRTYIVTAVCLESISLLKKENSYVE